MQLALKIDVETYRGTREGVPRLVELLKRHNAQASFFFSLGPDHSGRGIFGKKPPVPLFQHYGLKTLLYGTLLPAPDIGRNCADILRGVRDAGFDVGIHGYDHIRWRDTAAKKNAEWTRCAMQLAVDRYTEIFGEAPRAHAASGWQMNRDAFRLTQRLDFDYASDTRGTHPFIPTWDAEIIACPQLPTTLPTLDELLARPGITSENVLQHMLPYTANSPRNGHVFTLRAELEGGKWLPIFEQLLLAWKTQGYEVVSLRQYLESIEGALPRHEVKMGKMDANAGVFAVQV